jgi:predicted metal-dependent phosphoesterase TrpH
MKHFRGDLHIHTCLSPCAELEMSPLRIVQESLAKGLDFIAICDHNSAENAGAAVRAGAMLGIHVLPGLEINSIEEIHTLAIFDSEKQALSMQDIVYTHLHGTNRPDIFGEQVVVNEINEVEYFNERMLIASTQLGVDSIVREVHKLGGIAIASHVDRPSYSIISQLGFIPHDLELDAVELSCMTNKESFAGWSGMLKELPIIKSSDAHSPDDIGRCCTSFFIKVPCIDEIRMALGGKFGRRMVN